MKYYTLTILCLLIALINWFFAIHGTNETLKGANATCGNIMGIIGTIYLIIAIFKKGE